MMGDIQEFFVHNKVQNFYSVSISGYHIAEAGANPDQPARLHALQRLHRSSKLPGRGMHIDDFAPNLSFFFSTAWTWNTR